MQCEVLAKSSLADRNKEQIVNYFKNCWYSKTNICCLWEQLQKHMSDEYYNMRVIIDHESRGEKSMQLLHKISIFN